MPTPKPKRLVGDEANFRQLYTTYKRRARKSGRSFTLSRTRFRELTSSNCYVCGKPPSKEYRHHLRRPQFRVPYLYNGIDRFDNSEGYTNDNTIACCWRCNRAKADMSIEEFLLYLYEAYLHSLKPALEEGVPRNEPDEDLTEPETSE